MALQPTDAELVSASVDGDRQAFSLLAARHRLRARATAQRILGQADGAEDIEQEALLAAFLGLSRLREPAHFGGWLSAIAANLAKMRLRRREWTALAGIVDREAAPSPLPDEALEAAELLRVVGRALRVLPEAQQAIVVMHYVEGRTCEEISMLVGRSPVAVRVALHRARSQLRERLAPSLARATPFRKEDYPMSEVTVDDVVVRMLPGTDHKEQLAGALRIVLLREQEGGRVLPIWIGAAEGDALALQLGDESMPRPLTADLMQRLLEAVGARVDRVTVTSLREKTFYAVITVTGASGTQDVDARPSDALNLAARLGTRIFVEDNVLAEAAIAAEDDLEARLTEEAAKHLGEQDPAAEWQRLTPALVKSLHERPGWK